MCYRNQFSILLEDVVDETLLLEDEDEDETLLLEDEHDHKESRPDRPIRTVQREVIVNNVDSERDDSKRDDCDELDLGINTEFDTSDVLIFADILKHQSRKTQKGKSQVKWTEKLSELKDFVALLLDSQGSWKPRCSNGKQYHVLKKNSQTINCLGGRRVVLCLSKEIQILRKKPEPKLTKSLIN